MPIAQDMKNITEEIEVSYGERMSWLTDVAKDSDQIIKDARQTMSRIRGENKEAANAVAKLLLHFRNDHKAMAEALSAFLGESKSTRMAEFKEMLSAIKEVLSAIQARGREREEEVAALIKKFEDELGEMATKLKAFLSKSESTRLEEFKKMLADIKSKQRAREEEVAGLLTASQKDISQARTHWQNLAKIMASKRTGKRVPITEVPKEAEVSKRVEEAAEKAFTEGELKVKALSLIEESPKGISLRQIGSKLKVPYIRLARPIKELVDEGKVVKRDSLYFSYIPASTEA